MRIGLGIWGLTGFGGTESYSLTVAHELERLGHEVWIYTAQWGPAAEHAVASGLRVYTDNGRLPECDAVLSQDALAAYVMARQFPHSAKVLVAHSASHSLQSPPQLPGVCQAVVVMNDRLLHRTEALSLALPVVRLHQPIDLQTYTHRAQGLEQRRPPRVLLLSNYLRGARRRLVEEACRTAGLELAITGVDGVPATSSAVPIANAEIVVTIGRGVLEAMASGRAAYVYGPVGGDGWVTATSYPAMESEGFSGRATGNAVDADQLAADLSSWHEGFAETGRDLACTYHDVQLHAVKLVELLQKLAPEVEPLHDVPGEMARLVRLEWDRAMQVRQVFDELVAARADQHRLSVHLAEHTATTDAERSRLHAEAAQLAAECDAHRFRAVELEARLTVSEAELDATRRQLADADRRAVGAEAETDRLHHALAAVAATRTMRWTRVARRGYGLARRTARWFRR